MKKLVVLLAFTLALILSSCSVDNVIEQNQVISQNCGEIVSVGVDARGNFIEVKMPYHQPYQKDRYQVSDYRNYHLGAEICSFEGLLKQPL